MVCGNSAVFEVGCGFGRAGSAEPLFPPYLVGLGGVWPEVDGVGGVAPGSVLGLLSASGCGAGASTQDNMLYFLHVSIMVLIAPVVNLFAGVGLGFPAHVHQMIHDGLLTHLAEVRVGSWSSAGVGFVFPGPVVGEAPEAQAHRSLFNDAEVFVMVVETAFGGTFAALVAAFARASFASGPQSTFGHGMAVRVHGVPDKCDRF